MHEEPELDSSVMDRTKKLRQARDQFKKKARHQQSAEEESLHYDQLVAETREKVEAAKAAKIRTAESRRILEDLQSEVVSMEDRGDSDQDQELDPDAPVSRADIGALVASSIKSVVSISWIVFQLLPNLVSISSLS